MYIFLYELLMANIRCQAANFVSPNFKDKQSKCHASSHKSKLPDVMTCWVMKGV